MSWKYSSYSPRDLTSGLEAPQLRFGFSSTKLSSSSGDRRYSGINADSKVYKNSAEPVEHSPLWAKTRGGDGPATVQRLKERYAPTEEPGREIRTYKKAETKDLNGIRAGRAYGRSLTALTFPAVGDESCRLRKVPEKSPESEKTRSGVSSLEGRKHFYMPTVTTKLLSRKYSTDLSPTTFNAVTKDKFARTEVDDGENTITVVTRGTSPTPTTSTVYLRSKRTDFGLEKKVPKFRKKVEMAHKEVQTEREYCLSKFSTLGDSGSRTSWSSYSAHKGSSYNSKFSLRSNYGCEGRSGSCDSKKSNSREESEGAGSPDFSHISLSMKPPASARTPPMSPAKDCEKKILGGTSSPVIGRPPFASECSKLEFDRKPNSPNPPPSPQHNKLMSAEAPSPTVTILRCPDIPCNIDGDVSTSESSEEETSSEDDCDEPVPLALTVKKSVTNFLQNIPNYLPQNPSRSSLCNKVTGLSSPKLVFQNTESSERACWFDGSEKAEGVARARSTRSVSTLDPQAANYLSPPYMLNRQFSRDKDWLKGSCEDVSKSSGGVLPKEEPSPTSGTPVGRSLVNGEPLGGVQRGGNYDSGAESGGETFSATAPLFRRHYKSPEKFLVEDLKEQMKFNQQNGEYPSDFQRECTQKVQNGLGSPLEDKNLLDGMISRAKAGLSKSKTKVDIKKSPSGEISPKVIDTKSEIDLYWRELADSLSRPLTLCDLDFTDLNTDDDADILGNNPANVEVPPPPPMLIFPVPSLACAPPRTPCAPPAPASPRTRTPVPPPAPQIVKNKKTVKLFWKEVKDEPLPPKMKPTEGLPLIWDELTKVNVDTQKLEYLFESRAKDLLTKKQQEQNKSKEVIVLDPKRSNAINIGMTKLPPPRAIKTAILKMDATVVNKEGIDKLLTMLPTDEEKLRIQDAQAANPDVPLGSAEQFLITLASISEIEARLRLWAFKLNFDNNEKEICEPLMDLKQGMEILRANRTFRAILATLLSVGNFLNGCDAKGFQIDYLSKVPEVKDTVYKHSLLHHLCLIVMDKFPDSTDLYSEVKCNYCSRTMLKRRNQEIGAVTRASKVDFDELAMNIKKVEEECKLSWNYLKTIAKHEGHTAMKVKMSDFLADCAERIIVVGTVHKRIMSRFQKFIFWLGVPVNRLSTTRPNDIFKTISEFALEYRTTRDRVLQQIKKINREKSRTKGHPASDPYDLGMSKMNSKAAKDDARLKQLLRDGTTYSENTSNGSTWRRQRKDTKNLLQEVNNNDEEILDALIKTANQIPSSRMKERRRSRIYGKCCKCHSLSLGSFLFCKTMSGILPLAEVVNLKDCI